MEVPENKPIGGKSKLDHETHENQQAFFSIDKQFY